MGTVVPPGGGSGRGSFHCLGNVTQPGGPGATHTARAGPVADLAGEMGVLAFKRGYSEWLEADHDTAGGLAPYTAAALEDLRAASASLS